MKTQEKKLSTDYLSLLEKAKKDYEEYLKIADTLEVLTITEEDTEIRIPSLDRPLTKNALGYDKLSGNSSHDSIGILCTLSCR